MSRNRNDQDMNEMARPKRPDQIGKTEKSRTCGNNCERRRSEMETAFTKKL